MEIGLEIIGERELALRFDKFPETARINLREAITQSTDELLAAVRNAAPKRSGKLEASIQSRVSEGQNKITGIVAVTADFGKAGALEYGTRREINMKLTHLFSYILSPPLEIQRGLNIQPHNFLRGPENAIAESAFDRMEQAVEQAMQE
jgi:hypothetical protein